jgi:nitroreductase
MDTFDVVAARRSIHKFDPAHVMPEEDITRLLEAAILSPTLSISRTGDSSP